MSTPGRIKGVPHCDMAFNGTPAPGPWIARAACRGEDVNLFFPADRGDKRTEAKAICAACPVLMPCRAYALAFGPRLMGIWGGWSEYERRSYRSTIKEAS